MDNLMCEVSALTVMSDNLSRARQQHNLNNGGGKGVDSPTASSPSWIWSKPSPGMLRHRRATAQQANNNLHHENQQQQQQHLFRPVSNSPTTAATLHTNNNNKNNATRDNAAMPPLPRDNAAMPTLPRDNATMPPLQRDNAAMSSLPYYHEKKPSLVESDGGVSSLEGFNSLEIRRFELNKNNYRGPLNIHDNISNSMAAKSANLSVTRTSKLDDLRAISPPRISYRQRIKNKNGASAKVLSDCDKTQSSADSCYSRSDNSSELSEPPPPPRVPVLHPPLPPARNNYDTTSLSSISTVASSSDLWNVRAMPNVKITRFDRPVYLRPNPCSGHAGRGEGVQRSRQNVFDLLTDEIMVKILSYLNSKEIMRTARVSRRFYFLSWEPDLWRIINLSSGSTADTTCDIDRIISTLFQVVSKNGVNLTSTVKCIILNGCTRLTDRGLALVARRCKSLEQLNVQYCTEITNGGLLDLTSRCSYLDHLDVTGCSLVSGVGVPLKQPAALAAVSISPSRLPLHYLDMSDCLRLDDTSLRLVVESCPQLQYLFLRRCSQVTDVGIKSVASYCLLLRELSVSDCTQITDTSLVEIGRLGPSLRYLSLAKCDKITDNGIRSLVRHCYRLRYLNLRGLIEVTDESIEWLARSCTRLRSLDIGKCTVSDYGLQYLSENCPNLKKLSVKGCTQVTDRGVGALSYYCRGLQQLNIQEVLGVTVQGCRVVRSNCRKCIIEHTNPGLSA